MARREIKSKGKDVASAIIRGLNELGRRRDQVEVTVIQEEKSGFLGIGGRPAIVQIVEKKWDSEHSPLGGRLRDKSPYMDEKELRAARGRGRSTRSGDDKKPRATRGSKGRSLGGGRAALRTPLPAIDLAPKAPKENEPQKLPAEHIQNAVIPDNMKEPLAKAKESLQKILSHMGIKEENLNAWWDPKQQRILLTFDCDHPAVVIGKEGRTLESIQYLVTLMTSRDFENPISVMADTQNYWRKLEDKIDDEIEKAVNMLKRTKRPYKFRPMPAQVRRYVHRFFEEGSGISTASEGEGRFRKIVLRLSGATYTPEQEAAADSEASLPAERTERSERPARGGRRERSERAPRAERADYGERSERGESGRETARSKADLTPIDWDAISGQPAAEACEVKEAAQEAAPVVVEEVVAIAEQPVVSPDNAGASCVLTAETTPCKDVANTATPNPVSPEAQQEAPAQPEADAQEPAPQDNAQQQN